MSDLFSQFLLEITDISNIKSIMKKIPCLPGIYQFMNVKNNTIYIGKSRNLRKRISSYFQKRSFGPRITTMLEKVSKIQITTTQSESEALILENNLIKNLHPRYNILFRDDKSYPYILLSKDEWPRILHYRGRMSRKHYHSFGPFPNSWAVKETLRILQKVFQLRTCEDSTFFNRSRPCMLHQIGYCSAPCVGAISYEQYNSDVKTAIKFLEGKTKSIFERIELLMKDASRELRFEDAANLRNQMYALSSILKKQSMEIPGNTNADIIFLAVGKEQVCINLGIVRNGIYLGNKSVFPTEINEDSPEQILEAFLSSHYLSSDNMIPELIICSHKLNDKNLIKLLSMHSGSKHTTRFLNNPRGIYHSWLEQTKDNAKIFLSQFEDKFSKSVDSSVELAELLKLDAKKARSGTFRIECFDVSHIGGEDAQASCVVFEHNSMQKTLYRHYNISGNHPRDDCFAMKQVLLRRFSGKNDSKKLPDLVLIDGGKGQVSTAKKVFEELNLNSRIMILGIAKDKSRKTGLEKIVFADEMPIPVFSKKVLMLVLSIRDEAHRFAISGMRTRRLKKHNISQLEEIVGIGIDRRKNLLNKFGGILGVRSASVSELISVQGISHSLAHRIYEHFHQ